MLAHPLRPSGPPASVCYAKFMEISLLKDDDLSVVALKGRGSYEDRTKLRDYLDLLQQNDAHLVVIDLSSAEFVPASILGVLTQKADEFNKAGGRVMFVVHEDQSFSPLVSVEHLKKFFATAPTVAEAALQIRAEVVEEESVHALIRRAKPTPQQLPTLDDQTSSRRTTDDGPGGSADETKSGPADA